MYAADVRAVVVHHRSPHTVLLTVQDVVDQLGAERVLLVDNSEDDGLAAWLRSSLPSKVELMILPNRGYAAAVNAGAQRWSDSGSRYTLVATHECRFAPGSIDVLARGLSAATDMGVVGPTLINGATGAVWSQGGLLTRRLRLPRHREQDTAPPDPPGDARVLPVEWLDGACLLYRTSVILQQPLSEAFQIYFEELDHQLRLRKAGWRVGLVPAARVSQATKGVPPFWLARNLWIVQREHFGRPAALAGSAVQITRSAARSIFDRDVARLAELRRGLVAPRHDGALVMLDLIRSESSQQFTQAWARSVERCGYPVKSVHGPTAAGYGGASRVPLVSNLRMLWRARRWSRPALFPVPVVLVTGDPFGWFALLARMALGRRAWFALPSAERPRIPRASRRPASFRTLVHDRAQFEALTSVTNEPKDVVLLPDLRDSTPSALHAWMAYARGDSR